MDDSEEASWNRGENGDRTRGLGEPREADGGQPVDSRELLYDKGEGEAVEAEVNGDAGTDWPYDATSLLASSSSEDSTGQRNVATTTRSVNSASNDDSVTPGLSANNLVVAVGVSANELAAKIDVGEGAAAAAAWAIRVGVEGGAIDSAAAVSCMPVPVPGVRGEASLACLRLGRSEGVIAGEGGSGSASEDRLGTGEHGTRSTSPSVGAGAPVVAVAAVAAAAVDLDSDHRSEAFPMD